MAAYVDENVYLLPPDDGTLALVRNLASEYRSFADKDPLVPGWHHSRDFGDQGLYPLVEKEAPPRCS